MRNLNGILATMAIISLCSLCSCNSPKGQVTRVDAAAFEKALQTGQYFLLDVRTPEEYTEGHIAGAGNINLNAGKFIDNVENTIPKDMKVAVYCKSGNRSKSATRQLLRKGYDVMELEDGIDGWTEASLKLAKDEVDSFLTQGGTGIQSYCIKHGSVRMKIADKWIYVDPVRMSGQANIDYTALPKADVILITHEHGDHLDPVAISQLTKSGTIVIANPNSQKQLGKGQSMTAGNVATLFGNWKLTAVPAYNCSADKQNFHPKGRDNGYLLTVDGFTVYFAGDTEDIPELKDLPAIDVAFLPCNLPYTMSPEQLANAAKTIMPKVLFPYHYSNTDMTQVTDLLEGSGIDVRIRQYQ